MAVFHSIPSGRPASRFAKARTFLCPRVLAAPPVQGLLGMHASLAPDGLLRAGKPCMCAGYGGAGL